MALSLACVVVWAITMTSWTVHGAFQLTTTSAAFTVDTDAGLIFSVRRTDVSNQQHAGDLSSLRFNGVEYQDTTGSQINSGLASASVTADTTHISSHSVIVVTAYDASSALTHYYIARKGEARIYMGTYFEKEPSIGLVRFITRIPYARLPHGPAPSDRSACTHNIESSDVCALSNNQTRSKHYSNHRQMDWTYTGATGNNLGVWMVKGNHEGFSGGPFYRSLINQASSGGDQELYSIVNYGEGQTDVYRFRVLNLYALVFTTGATPPALDWSFINGLGLRGYVAASARGSVSGAGVVGQNDSAQYVIELSSAQAQYWSVAATSAQNGAFTFTDVLPGKYTIRVNRGELVVYSAADAVTVVAGRTTQVSRLTLTDPNTAAALWRIGTWDGSPQEFLNGALLTTMHPSDPRMRPWRPLSFAVASQSAATFPALQFRAVNSPITVLFTLSAAQAAAAHTLSIGITVAVSSGRPGATINGHALRLPAASDQPGSRTITVGTYRGNNARFSWTVPAADFVSGQNTLVIDVISGEDDLGPWLSPSFAFDCLELLA